VAQPARIRFTGFGGLPVEAIAAIRGTIPYPPEGSAAHRR